MIDSHLNFLKICEPQSHTRLYEFLQRRQQLVINREIHEIKMRKFIFKSDVFMKRDPLSRDISRQRRSLIDLDAIG